MTVKWDWKSRIGVISVAMFSDTVKINIYKGNCLGVLIREWKDKTTKKNMYVLTDYWIDLAHLKSLLGLTKNRDNKYRTDIKKIRLNAYYQDAIVIAKLFAKANIKVELCYKKEKEKK